MSRLPDKLDLALVIRLREVVVGGKATTEAQLRAADARLGKLNADPASPLAEMAEEIRRVDALGEELEEARSLLAGLEERARELRTAYLKHHADSAPRLS